MPGDTTPVMGKKTSGKNPVVATVPYHFLHEKEVSKHGVLEDVNTIFLTGKQCAFSCRMCDLWKNTLDFPTPPGAILKQIDVALSQLPQAAVIKLYNSSNFFDPRAVPPEDFPGIARQIVDYRRVIVENHPRLCSDSCLAFRDCIEGTLEIALGLETIHPVALPALNKQMTPADFSAAVKFLGHNGIDTRAFVLLSPPYLTTPDESVAWTLNTIRFAFESGASVCSVIATRPGTTWMRDMQDSGYYVPPTLSMLEEVFASALTLNRGRVFVDTWDIGFTSQCESCFHARVQRLEQMNVAQQILPHVMCAHCHDNDSI